MIPVPTIVQCSTPSMYALAWLKNRVPEGEYTYDLRGRYSFYYAEDAMAFSLKFDGTILQNEKSFD